MLGSTFLAYVLLFFLQCPVLFSKGDAMAGEKTVELSSFPRMGAARSNARTPETHDVNSRSVQQFQRSGARWQAAPPAAGCPRLKPAVFSFQFFSLHGAGDLQEGLGAASLVYRPRHFHSL